MALLWPAAAGAEWSRAVRVSSPAEISTYPAVAIDGHGNGTAVWTSLPRRRGAESVVMSSVRSAATGRWSRPVTLSDPRIYSANPEVAVDPAGAAVVVWTQGGVASQMPVPPPVLEARFRASARAPWAGRRRVSPRGAQPFMPRVGIDAAGGAVAIWFTGARGAGRIQSAVGSAALGSWQRPVTVAHSDRELINPELAVSSRGQAVVIWERPISGGVLNPHGQTNAVYAAVASAVGSGRSWGAPVWLGRSFDLPGQASFSFEFPGPQVAINASGAAVVAWQAKHGRSARPVASVRTARGRWSHPIAISRSDGLTPHVAIDAAGAATAIWDGAGGVILIATRSSSGRRFSAPVRLAPATAGARSYPEVSVDARGDAVATWTATRLSAAVRRGPHGRWRTRKLGRGGVSQVAVGPHGSAIVVWQEGIGRGIVVQAARYRVG